MDGRAWSASRPSRFTPGNEPWYALTTRLHGPKSQSGCFEAEILCMWTHRSATVCFVLGKTEAVQHSHLRGSTLSTAYSSDYHKNALLTSMQACRRAIVLTQVTTTHNTCNNKRVCVIPQKITKFCKSGIVHLITLLISPLHIMTRVNVVYVILVPQSDWGLDFL